MNDRLRDLSPEDTSSELVLDLIDQHGGSYTLSEARHEELGRKYGMEVLLLVVHEGDRVVLRAVALEEGPEAAGEAMLAMGVEPAEVLLQVARFRLALAVQQAAKAMGEQVQAQAAQRQADRRN